MTAYVIRRVGLMVITLLIVSFMVSMLVRIVPGDTVTALIADAGLVPQDRLDAVRADLGLDRPFLEQYGTYMWGILRGDFGDSLIRHQSTVIEVREALPVTLQLAAMAIITSIFIGVPLGIVAAVRRNGVVDRVAQVMGSVGIAVPDFFIGTVLIIVLAKYFHYLPPLGYVNFWDDPLTNLEQLFLPTLIIAFRLAAVTMRLTRSVMIEVLTQDYVRTAKAKGLAPYTVVLRHATRNAVLPVITVIAAQLGFLLGGALVMETLFSLPGLGQSTLTSISRRDYTQLQTNVMFTATVIISLNLIVDVAYAMLDPRVRVS